VPVLPSRQHRGGQRGRHLPRKLLLECLNAFGERYFPGRHGTFTIGHGFFALIEIPASTRVCVCRDTQRQHVEFVFGPLVRQFTREGREIAQGGTGGSTLGGCVVMILFGGDECGLSSSELLEPGSSATSIAERG
jgi:hypothetical protein